MHLLLIFLFPLFLVSQAFAAAGAFIVLSTDPDPLEVEAAEELAKYWELLSGHPAEIRSEHDVGHPPPRLRYHRLGRWRPPGLRANVLLFHVGETRAARVKTVLPTDLDPHGFALRAAGDLLFLRGGSPRGTQFAVYRFLHVYGGVRWYMPTELGEYVPEWLHVGLPEIAVVEEPAFLARQWHAVNRFSGDNWEKRNLLGERYRFNHNLQRIFTEAVYDLRPDFFIMIGGQRIRPDDRLGGDNYQICFGNPEAAIFAARRAADFFDENPNEISYSLAMADSRLACQCAEYCQPWIDPQKTFRGLPDYSDLVFLFMNRAAEELGLTHPDKYLGTLAYYWAENIPSFPVHPKVLPYLTADRPQWQDESFRQEDRDLIQRWSKAGPERLGMWDYYYGNSFVIPRAFNAIIGESLPYAAKNGVSGFFGEIVSNWGLDGPKAWLASQLLWNPDQDHEKLLEEFYGNFFQEAAGPMRSFYERAEELWMQQGGPAFWLKFYHDFTQLELFPKNVCAEMRAFLTEAEALAQNERVRQRILLVSEAFHQTELYSGLYHAAKGSSKFHVQRSTRARTGQGLEEGDGGEERSKAEVQGKVEHASSVLAREGEVDATGTYAGSVSYSGEELIRGLEGIIAHKLALEEHHEKILHPNVLHRARSRFEFRARFLPGMKAGPAVAALSRLLAAGDLSFDREELEALAVRLEAVFPESRAGLALRMEEAMRAGEVRQLLVNGDFSFDDLLADPESDDLFSAEYVPLSWLRWGGDMGFSVMALTDRKAAAGKLSLRAEGGIKESIYQPFSVQGGRGYAYFAQAKGVVSPGSRIEIRLTWLDAAGAVIEPEFMDLDPLLPGTHHDWQTLAVYTESPAQAVSGIAHLTVHHQAEGDYVYFDDVRVVEAKR